MDILKVPSLVLQDAGMATTREYALQCYKGVLLTLERVDTTVGKDDTSLFVTSFTTAEAAVAINEAVVHRLDNSLKETSDEQVVIFPPLLLRSNTNMIVEYSDNLLLVLFLSGPVVPVLRNATPTSAQTVLPELIDIYAATNVNGEFLNESNISDVFN